MEKLRKSMVGMQDKTEDQLESIMDLVQSLSVQVKSEMEKKIED